MQEEGRDVEELTSGELKYLIRYPDKFDLDKKYPILLFLHGAGTRSCDINKLLINPFFTLTEKYAF